MWFNQLTGFNESSTEQIYKNISVNGDLLSSKINGEKYSYGKLEIPSLGELRQRIGNSSNKTISVKEVVGDVQDLHIEPSNAGALFQVASQFNLLEMPTPEVTPEQGIDAYEYDRTQGPASAISAGAGTIYRNYFANVNGQIGQTTTNQIDCLADIGKALGNTNNCLWEMKNGYALASEKGLIEISNKLNSADGKDIDKLRKLLKVGVQWETQVTIANSKHKVTQVYCSALPVAYSNHSPEIWERFARLILEATYEATICTAILNYSKTGNNKVYLTLVGGGVFGNKAEWIIDAIERSLNLYHDHDIDVGIVSYGNSKKYVQNLVKNFHR